MADEALSSGSADTALVRVSSRDANVSPVRSRPDSRRHVWASHAHTTIPSRSARQGTGQVFAALAEPSARGSTNRGRRARRRVGLEYCRSCSRRGNDAVTRDGRPTGAGRSARTSGSGQARSPLTSTRPRTVTSRGVSGLIPPTGTSNVRGRIARAPAATRRRAISQLKTPSRRWTAQPTPHRRSAARHRAGVRG